MIGSRLGYTLLLYALLPRALLHLLWRARRQRAYLKHIPERFGYYDFKTQEPVVWVHAVSVGETRAAEPLIRSLRSAHPRHRILLTHMTPTGRETGEALYGDDVLRGYLPYDFPSAVARFLNHFRPAAGVLLETEIWPNLIHACRARNVPLFLVNARLSDKSFRRYRRFGVLTSQCLRELAGIGAQSDDDASRLTTLGAISVCVTGNLKFDIAPDPALVALGRQWREAYGSSRPVLLAASTRDGEEALLLDVLREAALPGLLFVIVPRHPQRFDEVASLIQRAGFAFQRRSANQPIAAETRVVLGDSMGEMAAYYAACDVALIGGSLLTFGAQNLIEACALGRPVIIGPSTYNFAEATRLALAAGGAIQVTDARGMMAQAIALLTDAPRARRMAQAAQDFARRHQGATGRVLELIKF